MLKTKTEIDFKYNFKIYFNILKKYRWYAIAVLSMVFLLEGSQTLTRYLFKIVVDNTTEFISNTLSLDSLIDILILLSIFYVLIIISRAVFNFLKLHIINRVEKNMILDLKRKYFNHIVTLSHRFHTSHKTGSLISRLIRGSAAIERLDDVIVFNVAPLLFQLIIVTGSLLYFDVPSSIVVVLTVLSFVAYTLFIQNRQKQLNAVLNVHEDREKAYISDVMTNIDSIKYYGKEDYIIRRFEKASDKTGNAFLKAWDIFRWFDAIQGVILGIGTFLLVYFPLMKLIEGNLTIGSLVFIYTVFGNLIGPLFSFSFGIRNYYRAMVDFEELFRYGKIENEVRNLPNALKLQIKKGEIEFKNISFKYRRNPVVDNFSLKINPKEKIALVGHSGCGKTTLVKLLYRFYDLDKGEILIDRENINKFRQESLRSELSIVPQECVLFDDTIYNNIAFSNSKASRRDVLKAMKFAQLDKIVKNFPGKEKTIVGERGVKLSGGEKQRVSIARAILANKKILVLDEATSSLDSRTESEIQKDLKKLMKNRTSIIIAHRLSTIMHADKVVVMDRGRIVQIGKHRELIKKPGIYKELWNLQKGGYIAE